MHQEQSTGFGILSILTFLPLIGALLLLFVPETFSKAIKGFAIAVTIVTFGISLQVLNQFQGGSYHFQMVEYLPWIKDLGIHYRMGIDGISIWLVMLTTFLMVVSTIFSVYVGTRVKAYMALMLILETAMLGVFLSLDMILFFTFFEITLIPMYFLIAIWGGDNRSYASIKFFIFTAAGSIFMLIGMLFLGYVQFKTTGAWSFSMIDIQNNVASGKFWIDFIAVEPLVFWTFALAFMVKCPMFPFHTWLPDAHTEAPTAGSIILAGILLKMGTYGFLRFCLPLFPDAIQHQVVPIMILAVVGIVYGAIVSAMQPDVKRLVAYSSVSHMGFVMLGIFSLTQSGLMGGAYQQLNHGISTGALFLLIGLIYERLHTRLFKDYGGLKAQMPIFAALFLIVMLSSVGLPGLNGFVGEFLAMLGAFEASYSGQYGLNVWYSVIAGTGVILAAVYLLWMFQKVFYGPVTNPVILKLKDLKKWEIALVGSLVLFVFWGGLFPNTFLKKMEASLGATRMMALNNVRSRPMWGNLAMEIDPKGNLVEVAPRVQNGYLENPKIIRILAPADLHYPLEDTAETAAVGSPRQVSLRLGR